MAVYRVHKRKPANGSYPNTHRIRRTQDGRALKNNYFSNPPIYYSVEKYSKRNKTENIFRKNNRVTAFDKLHTVFVYFLFVSFRKV